VASARRPITPSLTLSADRRDRIIVTDGGGPFLPTATVCTAEVAAEYIQFGQIDLKSARFSVADGLPSGAKVRMGFRIVKTPGYGGTVKWKIARPVPEPHVSLDAAIRYVTELRASSRDSVIRKKRRSKPRCAATVLGAQSLTSRDLRSVLGLLRNQIEPVILQRQHSSQRSPVWPRLADTTGTVHVFLLRPKTRCAHFAFLGRRPHAPSPRPIHCPPGRSSKWTTNALLLRAPTPLEISVALLWSSGELSQQIQERPAGVTQSSPRRVDQANLALYADLLHAHFA
jgi:hypothetical protein